VVVVTASRSQDERPLWRREPGWPGGWRAVAWLLAWPWLLASRWWDEERGSPPGRRAAVAVAVVFGVPWTLAIAVLVSAAVPSLDDVDGGIDLPTDLFAPLDEPVESPSAVSAATVDR